VIIGLRFVFGRCHVVGAGGVTDGRVSHYFGGCFLPLSAQHHNHGCAILLLQAASAAEEPARTSRARLLAGPDHFQRGRSFAVVAAF